jgi:hypothetical protein
MPRSVSLVGLARRAVIPQNNSTPECYCCDPVVLNSGLNSLGLPTAREEELKAAIAELLLTLVLDSADAATGGEYDEQVDA